jgi:STIP1 family protein 1
MNNVLASPTSPQITQMTAATATPASTTSAAVAQALKLKEEGNRLFMKRMYKEAIEMYSSAHDKAPGCATYLTNRALCHLKLLEWQACVKDCANALEINDRCVKAHFYKGQALSEIELFDEAVASLQRAHELSQELGEYYGDEITRSIRNTKRRRWNYLDDKRVKQEIELQEYLKRLMLEDKEREMEKSKLLNAFLLYYRLQCTL